MSTFDIDLDHLISAETAKQMTKVELNSVSFHRKFDGELKTVNLGLKRKDSNEKRIMKAHDKLGFGNIDEFIDKEDLDLEDCVSESEESEHEDDEDLVPLPLTETLEVKEEKENGIETVLISNDSMGAVGVQQLVKKKKKKRR